jgi:hypothetical protein
MLIPMAANIAEGLSAPLNFVYKTGGKEATTLPLQMTNMGLQAGQTRDAIPGVFIGSGHGSSSQSSADRFSELSKVNREREVIEVLKRQFPQIESLAVEVQAGTPLLYAYLPSVPERKLPMELISAGISKFLNILLSIAATPRGVIFVDEIENGFYYEQLPSICASLMAFCKKFSTQLFATTHSIEFVRAWANANIDEDLCLLRSSKADGYCEIKRFAGKDLHSAIEQGVEFR